MPFAPFFRKFLDIAETETRAVIVFDDPILPPGRYPFVEFYCDEPGCDCRRVIIHVMRVADQQEARESEHEPVRWLCRKGDVALGSRDPSASEVGHG